ncbi:small heat shock protein [Exidia glandulosa HHB12029]|uniref:Small heat shock protein n=1 Tax=Exidia glandulosa HHB12029 TaxID=1314781 RepID=A0A165N9M5_EXIGL|nr:small heat shock protein [Exidia glandulosa HHB12029]
MSVFWTAFPSAFSEFDRAFNDVFTGAVTRAGENNDQSLTQGFKPRMDVHESKDNNLVTATFELPGLKKEDVAIDVHNGRLTVSGEVKTSSEETKDGYVVRERRSGKFTRVLPLPQGVTPDNISAALNDGVLTVTFPKSTPEQEAKRIAVN